MAIWKSGNEMVAIDCGTNSDQKNQISKAQTTHQLLLRILKNSGHVAYATMK